MIARHRCGGHLSVLAAMTEGATAGSRHHSGGNAHVHQCRRHHHHPARRDSGPATAGASAMSAETETLVRWPRKRGGFTAWHTVTETHSDTMGRTGCGIRYERRHAEYAPAELATGHVCENCRRALSGAVPGQPS